MIDTNFTHLRFRPTIPLTLIVLGKVKIDLANFDVKFPTIFLCTPYWIEKKYLFLQKCLPNFFELHAGCQKMMFWHTFRHIYIKNLTAAPPHWPHFHSALLLFHTTKDREAPTSSGLQSEEVRVRIPISFRPGPYRVWVASPQLSLLSSSFYVECSGQIHENAVLYYTQQYRGR